MPDSPIERYLADLRRELRGDPLLARRVLEEVADHLAEATAARRGTMSAHDAEEDAIRGFGPAAELARRFEGFGWPLRLLLVLAAAATTLIAVWLVGVIATVLPARDPAGIPLWSAIATAFLAYSALTATYLVAGPRHRVLRAGVLACSLAAIAAGAYGIVTMIRRADAGHGFEGYVVLMGVALCGHGLVAIAYTALAARIARTARPA